MNIDNDYNQYEMCRIVNLAEGDAIKAFEDKNGDFTEEDARSWQLCVSAGHGANQAFGDEWMEITEETVYTEAFASKMLDLYNRKNGKQ